MISRGGHNRIDLTGQRFGRLVIVSSAGTANRRAIWFCICDCGGSTVVRGKDLRNRHTQSCGCGEGFIRHGLHKHRFYYTYQGMLKRCYDTKHAAFKRYGGRGITVCAEWRTSIETFLAWCDSQGEVPVGHTLDRRDNDGNYETSNCRFVSRKEQSANTRATRRKAA